MPQPVTRARLRRLSVALVASAAVAASSLALAPAAIAASPAATVPTAAAESPPSGDPALAADRAACTSLVASALAAAGQPTEVVDGSGSPLQRCLTLAAAGQDVSAMTAERSSAALGITPALPPHCAVTRSPRADAAAAINASLPPSSQPAERCAAVTSVLEPEESGVGAASVTAQAGGSISGTVTADGGGGLSGICVEVWAYAAADSYYGSSVKTGTGGAWTASGLPAGSYLVSFHDCRPTVEYVHEYYDDTRRYEDATPVVVTTDGAVTGIDAGLALGGAVAGKVTDAQGTGLGGICVYVSGSSAWSSGRTDSTGAYRVGGLATGTVTVEFTDCRGPQAAYVGEYYDDTYDYSRAASLAVTVGQTRTDVNASLSLGGAITGTVRESQAAGGPLADMCVYAWPMDAWGAGGNHTTTTADGTYRLGGLRATDHIVSFYDCNDDDVNHLGESYDDHQWFESSSPTPVRVTGTGTTSMIDAALDRAGKVSGRVVSDVDGAPLKDVCVEGAMDTTGSWFYSDFDWTGADGTYSLDYLHPGQNVITFRDCSEDGGHIGEHYDDVPLTSRDAAKRLPVTSGSHTTAVDASLALGGKITGVAKDSRTGAPVSDVCLSATSSQTSSGFDGAYGFDYTQADGVFSIGGLPTGSYLLTAVQCWGENYAWQYFDRVTEPSLATQLSVTQGAATGPVTVSMEPYRTGQGSIAGVVTTESGAAVSGAYVYTCATSGRCSSATTDAQGRYLLSGLTDQLYRVVATPPSGSSDLNSASLDVQVSGESATSAPALVLKATRFPPPTTTVGDTPTGQTPVVVVGSPAPVTITEPPCTGGGEVTVTVTPVGGGTPYVVKFTESSPGSGTFTGDIVVPFTGPADVVITQAGCSGTIAFNIYIDPSGNVYDHTGKPIEGATVTLYRADTAAGPFTAVPDGSSVMDPGNRKNPDLTDETGHFGWNVVEGYYKVRAEKAGCRSPQTPAQGFVETQVYEIPPPVVDIEMVLDCRVAQFVPLDPERLLDTRPDGPQTGYTGGKPAAGRVVELQVTGRGTSQVPADAAAVVLNVTAVGPTSNSFVTVYPCGTTRPLASNLNLVAGEVRPNLVVTKVGTGGKVCLYTQQSSDLIADLSGYQPAGSGYSALNPERLLDTRADGPQTGYTGSKPAAGRVVELQVTGRASSQVPADASAVVLNVTGVGPTSNSFVTVYPCGTTRPLASNLNLVAGEVRPNLVITKVGTGGKVCLYTQQSSDLIADVSGYYPAGSDYSAVNPERLLDTRADGPQTGYTGSKPAAGRVVELQVTGRGTSQVPADASAVVLNVTGVGPTSNSFVTVYPCGTTRPLASNLNLVTGQVAPNLVITKVGTGGKVCLYTQQSSDLIADISGFVR